MSLFTETITQSLSGSRVLCAALVQFDFATSPMRLWRGHGSLKTNDGNSWNGIGTLGSLEGVEQAVNGEAPDATFRLSGIDADVMRLARDEFEAEVKGRIARVYIQFFGVDDPVDPDNQRCLDDPYPVWAGRMLRPTFTLDPGDDQTPATRAVAISAESIFSLRTRPRHAMYTDADQQRRFPGDRGFEFVNDVLHKEVTWPDW